MTTSRAGSSLAVCQRFCSAPSAHASALNRRQGSRKFPDRIVWKISRPRRAIDYVCVRDCHCVGDRSLASACARKPMGAAVRDHRNAVRNRSKSLRAGSHRHRGRSGVPKSAARLRARQRKKLLWMRPAPCRLDICPLLAKKLSRAETRRQCLRVIQRPAVGPQSGVGGGQKRPPIMAGWSRTAPMTSC
jgi:hypothetical protein